MHEMITGSALEEGVDVAFLREKAPLLARDIAMELDKPAALAHAYGLDAHQWAALSNSHSFRLVLAQALRDLSGDQGTHERIRRKAALAVEASIVDLAGLVADKQSTPTARVGAFAELRAAAGIAKEVKSELSNAGQAGPLIVINMPNNTTLSIGNTFEGAAMVPA